MMESLYWLFFGFAIGFSITAGLIIWAFHRWGRTTCKSHSWKRRPDGELRCARCGLLAGEPD